MAKSGRGGKRGGVSRERGGSGSLNILNTREMVSERETRQQAVDETLEVFRDVYNEYGQTIDNEIQLAKLGAKDAGTLGYYDGSNIALNENYFNDVAMSRAYSESVKSGYHPTNGNKTALQAVVAHEIGHMLTDKAGQANGFAQYSGLDEFATKVVKEARTQTKHKGVVIMASKISRYATVSNAEAIAEAFSDVYCNGNKAHSESKAIMKVLNQYLGKK